MSLIQEPATYRGVVVEHAVTVTKKSGLPQFEVKLRALEKYSFEEKIWVNWSTREDCEMTAYLVMFDAKGDKIFHVDDIMRVFEWDGACLVALNKLDLEGAVVQFDVISDTYEGQARLKVAGIKGNDDTPGTGGIKKMDGDALAQMNAKFGNALKTLSGGPKAAKAPKATKARATKKNKATGTPPPPPAPTEEQAEAEATAPVAEPVAEKTEAKTVPATPLTPAALPAPPAPPKTAVTTPDAKTTTYEEAWADCFNRKAKDVSDGDLATAFSAAMHRIAPGKDETEISGTQWAEIAGVVIAEKGVF